MATQGEINAEVFKRINALEKVSSELSGYFKGMVENTKELISLMRNEQKHHKVVVGILASLLAFCIAALIYGAIGKDGLHAVLILAALIGADDDQGNTLPIPLVRNGL